MICLAERGEVADFHCPGLPLHSIAKLDLPYGCVLTDSGANGMLQNFEAGLAQLALYCACSSAVHDMPFCYEQSRSGQAGHVRILKQKPHAVAVPMMHRM